MEVRFERNPESNWGKDLKRNYQGPLKKYERNWEISQLLTSKTFSVVPCRFLPMYLESFQYFPDPSQVTVPNRLFPFLEIFVQNVCVYWNLLNPFLPKTNNVVM